MEIDLSEYVAGGYFVVKYSDHGFEPSELLPQRLISISNCIGRKLEIYWGWDTNQNRQDILDFGIPEEKFSAFETWSTSASNIGFPGVFYTLDAAREFIATFLATVQDIVLIGIGLPNEMVDDFIVDNPQTVYDPATQMHLQDLYGINYVLHQKNQLASEGQAIGFEVVGENFGLSCSWLCSGLEKVMHDLFGIHPNSYGLIDSYEDAKKSGLPKMRCKGLAANRNRIIPG